MQKIKTKDIVRRRAVTLAATVDATIPYIRKYTATKTAMRDCGIFSITRPIEKIHNDALQCKSFDVSYFSMVVVHAALPRILLAPASLLWLRLHLS
jgi:hypothetical protein